MLDEVSRGTCINFVDSELPAQYWPRMRLESWNSCLAAACLTSRANKRVPPKAYSSRPATDIAQRVILHILRSETEIVTSGRIERAR